MLEIFSKGIQHPCPGKYRVPGKLLLISFLIALSGLVSERAGAQSCTGTKAFTVSSPNCVGSPVIFTNTSTSGSASTYYWRYGDGNISGNYSTITTDTYTYAATGIYTVWLVRNGASCKDSVSHSVKVGDTIPPAASFSFTPNNACMGTNVSFTDGSTGANLTYLWDFGDGDTSTSQNPTHKFYATGTSTSTFDVKLTVSNGCTTDDTTITVTVKQAPQPVLDDILNVTTPWRQCSSSSTTSNFTVTAQNYTSGGSSYEIDWGDGSTHFTGGSSFDTVSHTYTNTGTFHLKFTATGSNGCSTDTTIDVVNESNPSVGLTTLGATNGCAPVTFRYALSSTNVTSSTQFVWDFGDGTSTVTWDYTKANDTISHTFTTTSCGHTNNEYIISVTATNGCGQTVATVSGTKIARKPIANFNLNATTGCAGATTFSLTDASTLNCLGGTHKYAWNFNDGAGWTVLSPAGANTTHKFNLAGTYSICHVVSNACGPDTICKTVTIDTIPLTNFSASTGGGNGCAPVTATFTNSTSRATVMNFSWSVSPSTGWAFQSGSTSTSTNPVIVFSSPGNYTVTLTSANTCGSTTKQVVIPVAGPPTVSLSPISNGCAPLTINPSATFNANNGTITGYSWTMTGGSPSSSTSASPGSVTYSAAGTYKIVVSVANACDTVKDSTTFTVNPLPGKSAGIDKSICAGQSTAIGGSSTSGHSYSWTSSPAGFTSSSANPTVNPSSTTTYYLTETITATGCATLDTVVVTVNPLPTVDAGSNETICIDQAAYSLSGFSPSGGTWSGTGVSSGGMFTPSTAGAGTHTLTYTYTNSSTGCTNSDTKTITVNALPTVTTGAKDTFCNSSVTVNFTGSPSGGVWHGSGVTSGGVFTPSTAGLGTHDIYYVYTNPSTGCTDSALKKVTVINLPAIDAGANDTVCISASSFSLTGYTPASGGSWSGTGVSSSGTFTPSTAGVGTHTLTYTYGTSTCQVTDTKIVKVNALPSVDAGSNETVCIDEPAYSLSGGSWSGSGVNSGGTFTAATAGSGTKTLTYSYTDPTTHCTNTDTKTITVNPLPTVTTDAQDTVCNSSTTVSYTGTPSGGAWHGTGVTSSGVFTPSSAGVGTHNLYYVYSDPSTGCTDSALKEVTVVNPTAADAGANDTVCVDASAFTLTGFSPAGGGWSGTGVSSSGVFTPSTAGVGTHTLTYTFGTGTCLVTDTKIVKVNALPTVDAGSNETVCFDEPAYSLSGFSPSGGSWSGSGVTAAGVFTASTAGSGTKTLTYSYTDPTTHCTKTDTKTITVNPLPIVSTKAQDTFCNSSTTVSFTGTPGGGTWHGAGVSSSGVFTPSTAGVGTHDLYYVYTDGSTGCTDSAHKEVTVINLPSIDAGANDTVCVSASAFSLSGFTPASGGTWSGTGVSSSGVFTPSTAGAGTFTLTYSYGTGTCLVTDTKIVKVNPLPSVNAGSDQTLCYDEPAFSLSGNSPSGGSWTGNGVTSGGTFTAATAGAGTHTLTYSYTDPTTHCTNTDTKTITVNALPTVTTDPQDTFCNTSTTVTFSGSPSGGVWHGTGVTSGGTFTPSTAGVGTHDLYYVFTDAGTGCTDSAKKEVTVVNPSTIDAGPDDTVCVDASAFNLTGYTPSSGGTWSGTGVSSGGVFTPSTAGAGTFTLTYSYGVGTCLVSDTKVIKVNALPTVDAGSNETVCFDEPAYNLTGNSPSSGGTWSGNGVTSGGVFTAANAGAGTHTLTYTYTDPTTHCTNSDTKTIKVNALPSVTTDPQDTFCNTSTTTTFTGGPSGGVWHGTGVTLSGVFTPSSAGVGSHDLYYVYTDAGTGCTDSAKKTVEVISPSAVDAGPNDTVCVDASAFSLNGFSPAGGSWSGTGVNSSGTFTPSTAGTGTFTLTYTYGVGTCQVSDTKIVKVNALPTVDAGSNETVCFDEPAYSLTGQTPSGGSWSGSGVTSGGTFTAATAGSGSHTLTYSYTDPTTHCTKTDTKTITVNPLPTVTTDPQDTFCNTSTTVNFTGTPSGGVWHGTGVTGSGTFTPSSAGVGSHDLYYVYTDGTTGCTDSAKKVVEVVNPSTVDAGSNDTVCVSDPDFNLSGFTPSSGGVWTGTGVTSAGKFSPATGAGTYTLTYSYGTGTCLVSDTKIVKVNALPTVDAGSNETVCYDEPAYSLTGMSPTGGTWMGNGVTSAGVFTAATAGAGKDTLTYTYTDPTTHCVNTDTKVITVNPLPTVTTDPQDTFCNTSTTVSFTGSPAGGVWHGSGVTSAGVFTPSSAGVGSHDLYYVYTDGTTGCTDSAKKAVEVVNPTSVDAGSNDTVCVSDPDFNLSGFTPSSGGVWTGTGVTSAGKFSPATGAGTYTLTYSYGTGTCLVSDTKIVKVNALPTVDAGSNETVCYDEPSYSLTGQTPTGGVWSGNGVTSAGVFTAATAGAGKDTLTYTYTDPTTHCVNTDTKIITVNPLPIVSTKAQDTFCNTSTTVSFTGSPAGGVWHGAGVTTAGVFTPSSAGVGTHNLYYVYTDGTTGCTDSAKKEVEVVSPAAIDAGANDTVCIDDPAYNLTGFTPSSGGVWTGTGVTSTGKFDPGTGVGTYTLTYSYGTGTCKVTDTKIVKVNPLPTVDAGSNQEMCFDEPAFTLTGQSPTGGTWSGNGVTSAGVFTAANAGSGTHTLTYTYQDPTTHCINTDTKTIKVNALPTVSTKAQDTFCNTSTTVTFSGSPGGGVWHGSGVTISGTFTPSSAGVGTHNIYYVYTDATTGCRDSAKKDVVVVNPVSIDAGSNDTVCVDAADYNLSGYTPSAGGTWSGTGVTSAGKFSPGTGVGSYTLTYTYGTGTCKVSDTKIVKVNALPTVDAGTDEVICFDKAAYTLTGQNPTGGSWSGTGVSSAGVFTASSVTPGNTYTLTYTYQDPTTHCTNKDTKTIKVNPLPSVSTKAQDTFCNTSTTVTFTGTPSGGVWHGKGVTISGTFTPTSAGVGTHNIYYVYTDPITGCHDSAKREVVVVAPVTIDAGSNDTVCISDADYNLTGYTPTSGGTWSGTGVTPGGKFSPGTAGAGTYTLTYTYGTGTCKVTDTKVVKVNPLPVVDAGGPYSYCLNEPVATFSGQSPTGGTWTGSGIVSATQGKFSPALAGVGVHKIVYKVTDPTTHCINTDTLTVEVFPLPVFTFTNDTFQCKNVAENFKATATGNYSYFWDFGDVSTGTGKTVSHSYNNIGWYDITLVATDSNGCRDTVFSKIRIGEKPNAFFTRSPFSGPGPLKVKFTNQSSGEIDSYDWDFGDGQKSIVKDPADITFQQSPNGDTVYYVKHTVTNRCGSTTWIDSVKVFPLPTAKFGTDRNEGCTPLTVRISNKSTGKPDVYFWDFGNGKTSNLKDPPPVVYTTDSVVKHFTIILATTNKYGTDTARWQITVYPKNVFAFFNPNPQKGCAPATFQFTDFSKGATQVSWSFGDGDSSAEQNPSHVYTKAGVYKVKQFVSNDCSKDTAEFDITVFPPAVVKWRAQPACASDSIQFINLSQNLAGGTWDFGDGNISIQLNPKHHYNAPGKYVVTLSGTSLTYGCKASFTDTAYAMPLPLSDFTATPVEGCKPLHVQFTNTGTDSVFYVWDFGDGNTSVEENPTYTFTDSGIHLITLRTINKLGCANEKKNFVKVNPYPISQFIIPALPFCSAPVTVKIKNTSTGAASYQWSASNGQNFSTDSATFKFDTSGTYSITLIARNAFGCIDTSQQEFTIYEPPKAQFVVKPSSCEFSSVHFTNLSKGAVEYFWDFGDTTNSNEKDPDHQYKHSGKYTVTLRVKGVGGCMDSIVKVSAVVIGTKPTGILTFTVDNDPTSGWIRFVGAPTDGTWYVWDFGDGKKDSGTTLTAPAHRYDAPGEYTIKMIVINKFGCSDTVEVTTTLDYFDGLFVPNALSPESGPEGERIFLPQGVSLKEYKLEIFNTWGERLWWSDKLVNGRPSEPFVGVTTEGVPLPQGVYVWKINAKFNNGQVWQGKDYNGKKQRIGTVTLIR